jgi:hypothetical protein
MYTIKIGYRTPLGYYAILAGNSACTLLGYRTPLGYYAKMAGNSACTLVAKSYMNNLLILCHNGRK